MEQIDEFLEAQAADGSYQDTGSFLVDFSKAHAKSRKSTLPKPEQWVVRLLQAFTRLRMERVAVVIGRKRLTAVASSSSQTPDFELAGLFREGEGQAPLLPLQDAVLGAINRGLLVKLLWRSKEQALGFQIDGDSLRLLDSPECPESTVVLEVQANQGGMLYKMFGKADFGPEIAQLAKSCFLVPYALTLDGRPYDFEGECTSGLARESSEVRIQPCREDELGIRPPISLTPRAVKDAAKGKKVSAKDFDFRFLLQIRWNSQASSTPLLHWVVDGVCLQSVLLRDWNSPLWLDLYLSADGFATDLTGLKLVESEILEAHRRKLERFAIYSLLTHPPRCAKEHHEQVLSEVKRFSEDLVLQETLQRPEGTPFENETKSYQTRLKAERALYDHALGMWNQLRENHLTTERVKANYRENLATEHDEPETVPDWQACAPLEFSEPQPSLGKLEEFCGDVYVRFAKPRTTESWERPQAVRKFRK